MRQKTRGLFSGLPGSRGENLWLNLSRRNTTDLLQEHLVPDLADHFEDLFGRFLEFAGEKAMQYTNRLPQAHGHTSTVAGTAVRQALAWIVASPEQISLDDSDAFERVLAAIVYRSLH
ncbi:MAG UNVERIFIED_CONTAM: hypothetical protein LVR18_52405 [Planctomycetaceae bacterium]|jgi:hypothetical protein